MAVILRSAARSDVGLIRQGNEDSGYAGPRLLMVADGMGGHAAGELASAAAVATVADIEAVADMTSEASDAVLDQLDDAIVEIGNRIAEVIARDPELTGMGTTVTAAFWLDDRLAIAHIGDSRAYLLRDGELSQLTHDHTYVQTLVDAGRITEAEASVHPRRSLLMRALDGLNPVEPDLFVTDVEPGDRIMLCSDGLCGVVPREILHRTLLQGDPTGAVTRLVDIALELGAPDNVTVVVADVAEVPETDAAVEDEEPVVVGAAGETRVRLRLPGIAFPDDAQPDPDRPDAPPDVDGPPTAPQPLIDADIVVPASSRALRPRSAGAPDPQRTRRRGLIAGIIALVVVIALVAVGALVAKSWVSSRWYVGLNGSPGTGTVAVYQGTDQTLLGIQLSTLYSDSGIAVGSLPYFDQELVSKTIAAHDIVDADRIVSELARKALDCQSIPIPTGCPGDLQ